MDRKEIVSSQEYKAQGIALDWWRRNGYDIRDGVVDIIDAYGDGVIYGWNNPQWIPVEDELPKEGGEYLVSDGTDSMTDIWLYGVGWSDPGNNERVTHWMPKPIPPRKEE